MDVNDLRGFITLAVMLAFLAVCWWAYRSGNRTRFERDALIPFAEEAPDPRPDFGSGEGGER